MKMQALVPKAGKKVPLKVLKYEVFSFPLCSLFVCQGVFSLLFNVLSVEELAF